MQLKPFLRRPPSGCRSEQWEEGEAREFLAGSSKQARIGLISAEHFTLGVPWKSLPLTPAAPTPKIILRLSR